MIRGFFQTWLDDYGPEKGTEDPRRVLIRLMLREYRRHLRREVDKTKRTSAERLNSKRYARRKASELARRLRGGARHHGTMSKRVMAARYAESHLLTTLFPDRKKRWLLTPRRNGPVQELTVKNFNFIDHPLEAVETLYQIAELECVAPEALLHFDDPYCMDIAPYLVLAEMRPAMAPVFRGGRMPEPIQKVLAAVGLSGPLNMRLMVTNLRDVWAFPLKQRRIGQGKQVTQTLAPQKKEQVADDYCDALDQWLAQGDLNMELTPAGRAAFATIITELLDNAERHSVPDNLAAPR